MVTSPVIVQPARAWSLSKVNFSRLAAGRHARGFLLAQSPGRLARQSCDQDKQTER